MSRKKGKSFRKYVLKTASVQAISMQHVMSEEQLVDLGTAIHVTIERMRIGAGIEMDFHTLASMVNVSMVLCERGAGAEWSHHVADGQHALMRVLDRADRTGKWSFDGEGLRDVSKVAELYEAQIAYVTRDEARSAMREVYRRMNRGQVLNPVPGQTVRMESP